MTGILVAAVASAMINVVGVVPPIVRILPTTDGCFDVYANIEVTIIAVEGETLCKVLTHCHVCSYAKIEVRAE